VEHGVLALIGVPLESGTRAIGVTTRAGWRPTPVQARFLDLLKETATEIKIPEIG
jgi:GAF domain-containing protein